MKTARRMCHGTGACSRNFNAKVSHKFKIISGSNCGGQSGTGQFFLWALQLSPVSIIPPSTQNSVIHITLFLSVTHLRSIIYDPVQTVTCYRKNESPKHCVRLPCSKFRHGKFGQFNLGTKLTISRRTLTCINLETQLVPRSKLSPPQLYKPVSQCCIGK